MRKTQIIREFRHILLCLLCLCILLAGCAGEIQETPKEAATEALQTQEETVPEPETGFVTEAETEKMAMTETAVEETVVAEPVQTAPAKQMEETTAAAVESRLLFAPSENFEGAITGIYSESDALTGTILYQQDILLEHFDELKNHEGFVIFETGIRAPERAVRAQHRNERENPTFEVKEDGFIYAGHRFRREGDKILTNDKEILKLVWYDADGDEINTEPELVNLKFCEAERYEQPLNLKPVADGSRFTANTNLLPGECFQEIAAYRNDHYLDYVCDVDYVLAHYEQLVAEFGDDSEGGGVPLETYYKAPEGAAFAKRTTREGREDIYNVNDTGCISFRVRISVNNEKLEEGYFDLELAWYDEQENPITVGTKNKETICIVVESDEPVILNESGLPEECFTKPAKVEEQGNTTTVTYYLNKEYASAHFTELAQKGGILIRTIFKMPKDVAYFKVPDGLEPVDFGISEEVIAGEYSGIDKPKYSYRNGIKMIADDKETSLGTANHVVRVVTEDIPTVYPEAGTIAYEINTDACPANPVISQTYDEKTGVVEYTADTGILEQCTYNDIWLGLSSQIPEGWEFLASDSDNASYPPYLEDIVAASVNLRKNNWSGYEEVLQGGTAEEVKTFTFRKPDGTSVDLEFTIVIHGKK